MNYSFLYLYLIGFGLVGVVYFVLKKLFRAAILVAVAFIAFLVIIHFLASGGP